MHACASRSGTNAPRLPAAMLPKAKEAAERVSSSGASKPPMIVGSSVVLDERSISRPISPMQSKASTAPSPESCEAKFCTAADACAELAFAQHAATACDSAASECRESVADCGSASNFAISASKLSKGSCSATSCPRKASNERKAMPWRSDEGSSASARGRRISRKGLAKPPRLDWVMVFPSVRARCATCRSASLTRTLSSLIIALTVNGTIGRETRSSYENEVR